MTVIVGNRRFSTLSAASEYYTAIKRKYSPGSVVAEADRAALLDLLQHHGVAAPDEIARFTVENSTWGKPCFYAVCRNGVRHLLSANRLAGLNKAPEAAAKLAFRLLARNETKLARERLRGTVSCFHCREPVRADSLEMDHYPEPFDDLLSRFLRLRGQSLSGIRTVDHGEGRVALLDGDLRTAWMAFHRENAALVPAHRRCNRPGR